MLVSSLTCFVLAVSAVCSEDPPTEVLAETWDGREVHGTIDAPVLIMITEFGFAHIQLDKLLSIESLGHDSSSHDFLAITDGGSELLGQFTPETSAIELGEAPNTVRLGDVRILTFMLDHKPRGVSDFSGDWASNFGPMTLTQNGLQVTGTFGFDDEYDITGRVKGQRLDFTYEPGGTVGWFDMGLARTLLKGGYRTARGESGFWGAYLLKPSMPEPVPGEIVTGQSKSMLNFYVRVPEGFDPDRPMPAIAILHGSNMTARDYVETIAGAWPYLAQEFILVGIDGERLASNAMPERMVSNYTYINFSGPGVGPKSVQQQSPALVAATLQELQDALPIDRWFLGGHSQGGFLTYAVAMFYPQLIAGAFPMSCNLLVQCEPDNFKDEAVRAAQRSIVFAPIHGTNDPVVDFSGGEYCYRALQDGGFPAIRFFTDDTAKHMFARLPVPEAVRWLETMTGEDAAALVSLAEQQAESGGYHAACAAIARARSIGVDAAIASRLDAVEAQIEELAAPMATSLLLAIKAAESNAWVDDFWTFRRDFALTPAAQLVLEAYAELREQHAEPAQQLFYKSRRERDEAARTAIYREILEDYYASKWWPLVKEWVGDESTP